MYFDCDVFLDDIAVNAVVNEKYFFQSKRLLPYNIYNYVSEINIPMMANQIKFCRLCQCHHRTLG